MVTIDVQGTADRPATDIGYLLHKHPDRVQRFDTSQGVATVFYPVADAEHCRMVLHVDGAGARTDPATDRYVNTVPYAASSRLVVAMGKVLGDTISGRCAQRPELVEIAWPVTITVPSVPMSGRSTPTELFGPLDWDVAVTAQRLTPAQWGDSHFATLTLSGHHTLADALRQLTVLLPVLGGDQHYFVDDQEIDKLERRGAGWLDTHPLRTAIISSAVKRIPSLTDLALERLGATDTEPTEAPSRHVSLARHRRERVAEMIRESHARTVLDIGCGEGRLLADLAADRHLTALAGVDVSMSALQTAGDRLARWRHVELWQSSLSYTDPRCRGYDAVVLMEVIEHIDPARLPSAVAAVFDEMAPTTVVVTTPNRDYNVTYGLGDGFRHPDHRFEFSRGEFRHWCETVGRTYGYRTAFEAIGDDDPELGPATQAAVFTRVEEGAA